MGQITVEDTVLAGVKIITPKLYGDNRGYFFESWNKADFSAAGIDCPFLQDNESRSSYGVIRGLHYQAAPYTQAKLVRVIYGRVLDVAVDIRVNSPTFGKFVAVELSGENKKQLFIPRGYAHGFSVLSQEAVFAYKCDNIYAPSHERGIIYNDAALNIPWGIPEDKRIFSAKDLKLPSLSDGAIKD